MGAIKQYVPKPIREHDLEAAQWDGTPEDAEKLIEWFAKNKRVYESLEQTSIGSKNVLKLKSGDMTQTAHAGDYLVFSSKSKSERKRFRVLRKDYFESSFHPR